MKKKNVKLQQLSFSKSIIVTLTGPKAEKIKGGATFSCDDDTYYDCPFATRFIDCKSVIPNRC